jgi:hypothetical protein
VNIMRGQALRYSGWMLADRHVPRLLGSLAMGAAMLLPIWVASSRSDIPASAAANFEAQMHQTVAFIAALLCANGIISVDRYQNYFRFYLAKPVSPLWFYGEHIVLAGVTMVAVSAGYVTVFATTVQPLWTWALLQRALVLWLLIGMPIVLLSTVSRHDWLWGIVPWLLSSILRGRWPTGESTLGDVLHAVLPPYHYMGNEPQLTAAAWLWMGGWALGFFALTLLILARRPLAED